VGGPVDREKGLDLCRAIHGRSAPSLALHTEMVPSCIGRAAIVTSCRRYRPVPANVRCMAEARRRNSAVSESWARANGDRLLDLVVGVWLNQKTRWPERMDVVRPGVS
jgi:hypothetical protein